jgi:coenzyme PQQ biosynthesis protein PqqD
MNQESIPLPNADFNLEEIDNELLLYHPARTRAVYLNQTAALVWQLCDSERSVAEIVSLLEEHYPESETVKDDVESTLKQLADNGAIDIQEMQ